MRMRSNAVMSVNSLRGKGGKVRLAYQPVPAIAAAGRIFAHIHHRVWTKNAEPMALPVIKTPLFRDARPFRLLFKPSTKIQTAIAVCIKLDRLVVRIFLWLTTHVTVNGHSAGQRHNSVTALLRTPIRATRRPQIRLAWCVIRTTPRSLHLFHHRLAPPLRI